MLQEGLNVSCIKMMWNCGLLVKKELSSLILDSSDWKFQEKIRSDEKF